jgi:hypothetical protein
MKVAPPAVVSVDQDCLFYRGAPDAAAAGIASGARVFDSDVQRLGLVEGELRVSRTNPDGAKRARR